MNFHDQSRACHTERSEESRSSVSQILRCAQYDILVAFQPLASVLEARRAQALRVDDLGC
jgi:hypothetical protein